MALHVWKGWHWPFSFGLKEGFREEINRNNDAKVVGRMDLGGGLCFRLRDIVGE